MKQTPLHTCHINLGAKMGEFAGYDMPLFYTLGVLKEHEWVRQSAGLFDVSHMGQVSIKGIGATEFLERLTPSSYEKLPLNRAKYSVLMNESGGIIDDLMVTKTGEDEFHLVINAGSKDKDIAWFRSQLPSNLELTHYDDWALLALQGPESENIMRDVLGIDLIDLPYMALWYKDYTMFVSRLGYTGEDGFEISVPAAEAAQLWNKLLADTRVKPIGLAARDSLRLEMGYCLYGHDIDEMTTPLEADLKWIMRKDNWNFLGAEKMTSPLRRRVGIVLTGKGIAREGAVMCDLNGVRIGRMTSGGYAPSLKQSIGMGYVPIDMAQDGTEIFVTVRETDIPAKITKMPFQIPHTKSAK